MRDSEELARVICEREPTRASTVVGIREKVEPSEGTTITVDPSEISNCRRTTVAALRRRLRGDLDTVVRSLCGRSRNAATPRSINLVKISAVIWKGTRSAPVKIPAPG